MFTLIIFHWIKQLIILIFIFIILIIFRGWRLFLLLWRLIILLILLLVFRRFDLFFLLFLSSFNFKLFSLNLLILFSFNISTVICFLFMFLLLFFPNLLYLLYSFFDFFYAYKCNLLANHVNDLAKLRELNCRFSMITVSFKDLNKFLLFERNFEISAKQHKLS